MSSALNIDSFTTNSVLAGDSTSQLSEDAALHKKEFGFDKYHGRFTKAIVTRLSKLSRAMVDSSMAAMEAQGYKFSKKQMGKVEQYDLTIENVTDIYQFRNEPKLRDMHAEAIVLFIANMKGGVSKSVSTANLAHALRTHPLLLKRDVRVLVIDLDPQASATVMLSHLNAIGTIDNSSAQAMLQNVSREELLEEFICKTKINNVDVMPASIDDGFIASDWEKLCEEHLPGQHPAMVLKENVIDKLKGDYDYILVDSGPHLDFFLKNSIVASDVMATPLPPSQIDLHSSLRYTERLPFILQDLIDSGVTALPTSHFAFMTKLTKSSSDKDALGIYKGVFREQMLESHIPNSIAFQRCAETFDTVISVNPKEYDGDAKALKNAKTAIEDFAFSVYQQIEHTRAA